MISDAEQLAKQGKPHLIEIQGAQYEGTHGLVQHPGRQRGRQHPDAERAARLAGAARGERAEDHEAAGHLAGGRPVAAGADGGPEPAGHGERRGGLRAELPVRLPVDEGRQAGAVQALQVGACTRGSTPTSPPASPSAASTWRSASTRRTPTWPSRPRSACGTAQNQLNAAIKGGLPPTLESLYHDPAMFPDYPFHADILTALQHGQRAAARPRRTRTSPSSSRTWCPRPRASTRRAPSRR